MRIRIHRVPLTSSIEDFDLSHYAFCEGHVYEIGQRLAELLIVLGYAEPERVEDRASTENKRQG